MTQRRSITAAAILISAAIIGMGIYEIIRVPRSFFAGFDRSLQRNYEQVALGSSKGSAIDSLGEPHAESETFSLPQKQGFEHYFDAAERSNAVEYVLWINGMNWYYCIGFDESGSAVIKGEGHS